MALVVGAATIAALTLVEGFASDARPVARFLGLVMGMFGTVALLGLVRLDINSKQSASGRFADWAIPASRVALWLVVLGWSAGLVNLFSLSIEFSRRFT